MAEGSSDGLPRGDAPPSGSYRQDFADAIGYALIGAIILGGTAVYFAFLDTPRGRTGAVEFFSSFGPISPRLALRIAHFVGYVVVFQSALSFLMVAYTGVVRPLQRATGSLDSAGTGDTDDPRTSISVELADGRQTFQPAVECIECEETAIGVLSSEFENSTPGEAVAVCPMHLHERRDELEARDQRVEVETFV